jgi:hypothetical protein
VRKELLIKRKGPKGGSMNLEERRILESLAEFPQTNFVPVSFWYTYDDLDVYAFPYYPINLETVLTKGQEPSRPLIPNSFGRSVLKHWLWQGMVDIVKALHSFHIPEGQPDSQDVKSLGHFNLKPACILINSEGILLITDFGRANSDLKALTNASPTLDTYQPPPSFKTKSDWYVATFDVWSIACMMIEVILYILAIPEGSEKAISRIESFRQERQNENTDGSDSRSFWTETLLSSGAHNVKSSVSKVISSFRSLNDRYLTSVSNLLQDMLSIDPETRPLLGKCYMDISQPVATDDWPLIDVDEISISGLGCTPSLRNM